MAAGVSARRAPIAKPLIGVEPATSVKVTGITSPLRPAGGVNVTPTQRFSPGRTRQRDRGARAKGLAPEADHVNPGVLESTPKRGWHIDLQGHVPR